MHVLAAREEEKDPRERRVAERRPAATPGVLRHFSRGAEFIDLVDISTHGCGFTSRWPFEAGARVFLGLPGFEPRMATIAWHEQGQGGLRFDRPLRAAVAERFAARTPVSKS
ncbi:MAG TPA: PilZ domain-containing protein [Allosphingosinicella sp.]|nr:PilZ domain-containing protein [Allosphingosinicella sp.]